MYNKEQLRLKNFKAPDFPELTEDDIRPELLKGVRKSCWSFEEASYYLKGYSPDQELSSIQLAEVEQTLFWLRKSEMEYTHGNKASPGDYCRFLWAAQYPFSLKIWLLYEMSLKGDIKNFIKPHKVQKRYKIAIEIIQRELGEVTVKDVTDFLVIISGELKDDNGLPLLPKKARDTIHGFVKNNKEPLKKRGRPISGTTQNPFDKKSYLIDIIKKELGYLVG